MSWELLIPGIAIGLSLLTAFVQARMHDREKALDLEFKTKRMQRDLKALQKAGKTEEMLELNKQIMSLTMDKFRLNMRPMMITTPLFLIIWLLILSPMLRVGPLVAGEVSEVGVSVRNLDKLSQNVTVELVSDSVKVKGENLRELVLDGNGDQGDKVDVWWDVTSSEGKQSYAVKVTTKTNKSDQVDYEVNFVSAGALAADFTPGSTETLRNSIEATPLYHTTIINIFGISMDWIWYYIGSFLILGILLLPLKNQLMWGHHKGVNHLEKLDREKREQSKE